MTRKGRLKQHTAHSLIGSQTFLTPVSLSSNPSSSPDRARRRPHLCQEAAEGSYRSRVVHPLGAVVLTDDECRLMNETILE